jgi:hypothetical protein
MKRIPILVTAATIALLSALLAPATAYAIAASGTDPTGDVKADGTRDITKLSTSLDFTTVGITIEVAQTLPPLSDSSWSTGMYTGKGRGFIAILGPEFGRAGFELYGNGLVVKGTNGQEVNCPDKDVQVSGNTITMTAPAWCFRYPAGLRVMAQTAPESESDDTTFDIGTIDIAIAGPFGELQSTNDIEYVSSRYVPGGYYQLGADGGVFSFGDAKFFGSTGGMKLNEPVVDMQSQPNSDGYRFVARDGGVFAYGSAGFHGSMGGQPLNRPIVGMERTPSGNGYWLVASDGGIFAFGDAPFLGSMGGKPLNKPIVGMARTPSGLGYWLVASDGGIFAYGDANFYGSAAPLNILGEIVDMGPSLTGRGYLLVGSDGGVFAFGDAQFHGSGAGMFASEVVGINTYSSDGYYLTDKNGYVFNFGGATAMGSVSGLLENAMIGELNGPIVGFTHR